MTTPWNYLSHSEWQQVQNGINKVDATHMLIKRIQVCGLKSLKEDTQKYLDILFGQPSDEITNVLLPVFEMYKFCAGYFRGCGGSTSACWFGKVPT